MDQDKYQQNTALEQTVSTLVEQQMLVKRQSSLSVVASNRMAKVPNYDGSKLVKKSSHKLKPFRKSRSDAESSKSISLLAKPPIPHHHPIVTESSGVSPTKKRMVASSAFNWASKVEAPINSASVTITPLPTNSSTAFNETVDLIPQMESGSDFSVVSSVQPVPDLTGQIPSSPVVRSIPRSTEQQQREAIFLLKKKKELDDLLLMQQKHRAEISLRWKQRCAEKRQKIISYKPKSNSYSAISNQASNSAQQSSQQHSVATKPINLNPSVGTIALNGFGVKNQFQNLNSLLPATKNSGVITLKLTNNNLQSES